MKGKVDLVLKENFVASSAKSFARDSTIFRVD